MPNRKIIYVLILEIEDLLYYDGHDDILTNIKVDKQIFDAFDEGTCIHISFSDSENPEKVYAYLMADEDEDGIEMSLLW